MGTRHDPEVENLPGGEVEGPGVGLHSVPDDLAHRHVDAPASQIGDARLDFGSNDDRDQLLQAARDGRSR